MLKHWLEYLSSFEEFSDLVLCVLNVNVLSYLLLSEQVLSHFKFMFLVESVFHVFITRAINKDLNSVADLEVFLLLSLWIYCGQRERAWDVLW